MSLRKLKKKLFKSSSRHHDESGLSTRSNSASTSEIFSEDSNQNVSSHKNTEEKEEQEEQTDILDDFEGVSNLAQPTSLVLDVCQFTASMGSTILDPVSKFFPIVGDVANILNQVIHIYDVAQHNKKICGVLLDRVTVADAAVRNLKIRRKEYISFFTKSNYLALKGFVNTIKEIKKFASEISQLSKISKYLRAESIDDTFRELAKKFDDHMNVLQFAITIDSKIQSAKDAQVIKEDLGIMKDFLGSIGSGITNMDNKVNEIVTIISTLNENFNNSVNHQPSADDPLNINDYEFDPNSVSSNKKVHRRTRKSDKIDLAFKELSIQDDPDITMNSVSVQVTILKKLQTCEEIIKFIGLCKDNDNLFLVTEWVDNGNLREFYKSRTDLDQKTKISFALDIARGLNFLASVQMLHRDLSSENILITLQKKAKIANFSFSRGISEATRNIKANIKNVRYTAPEKLRSQADYKNQKDYREHTYDTRCEVYSFGVLLWEIWELKIPYEDDDSIMSIRGKVIKGYREKFSPGVHPDYERLVSSSTCGAWNDDPRFRPNFTDMFLSLKRLFEAIMIQSESAKNSPNIKPIQIKKDENDIDSDCMLTIDYTSIGDMTLYEAIAKHEEITKNHEEDISIKESIWKCFEEYAALGDIDAKYWKGYYLYYNELKGPKELESQRTEEAMQLFKEAADEGNIPEAQLRYGNYLSKMGKKEKTLAPKYFQKAADNGNVMAMYNIGNMYYRGILVKKNIAEGERYLRLAACNQNKPAIELLDAVDAII
ncbi:1894_t:CDS:2 [Diversispora eburnea]|uniref:1894_t:CDS:1 n=1 Tax=Diversispora eburnea TaxID=1213867 RepID=A0A9N9G316_9GLOM|nr:1894_t:CDS:2 [Diversispora eburnea]